MIFDENKANVCYCNGKIMLFRSFCWYGIAVMVRIVCNGSDFSSNCSKRFSNILLVGSNTIGEYMLQFIKKLFEERILMVDFPCLKCETIDF